MRTALFLSMVSGMAVALPAGEDLVEKYLSNGAGPDPSLATQVTFHGSTFINKVCPSSFLRAHDLRYSPLRSRESSYFPNYRALLRLVSFQQMQRIQLATPSVGLGVLLALSWEPSRPKRTAPLPVPSSLSLTVDLTCASKSHFLPMLADHLAGTRRSTGKLASMRSTLSSIPITLSPHSPLLMPRRHSPSPTSQPCSTHGTVFPPLALTP